MLCSASISTLEVFALSYLLQTNKFNYCRICFHIATSVMFHQLILIVLLSTQRVWKESTAAEFRWKPHNNSPV